MTEERKIEIAKWLMERQHLKQKTAFAGLIHMIEEIFVEMIESENRLKASLKSFRKSCSTEHRILEL